MVACAEAVTAAARAGDGAAAIAALARFRVLCAHRRGPYGVSTWTARIEGWLADAIEDFGTGGDWYVGRPLLVTENDYALGLYNGDTGVVLADGSAAFERQGELLHVSPTRLAAVDTVYAMTVHKSQGSQFDTAAVLLPDAASPLLTRELLYTAVTRAQRELVVVGERGGDPRRGCATGRACVRFAPAPLASLTHRRSIATMGERTSHPPGTLSWAELATSDADAAKSFYTAVFGWDYDDNPIPDGGVYSMAKRDGKYVAALFTQQDPPHWNCYVTVASADAGRPRAPPSSAAPCSPSRSTSWTPAAWR